MSKRFDIHEWQAKIRLNELNETQPIVYTEPVFGPGGVPTKPVNAPGKISKNTKKSDKTAEQLDLSDNPKYMNAPVTKYNCLPIRDNVMDYASQILNQINDYENNVGPGEVMIDYSGTRDAVEALMDAVDRDEEDMDTIAQNAMREVEVTGMEPDTGNMESEYKVIGPKNQLEPLDDVTIEYNGKTYVVDFDYEDVIDDHGNEGKDVYFVGMADDGTEFTVDVYVDANYDMSGNIGEIFWDTLEITPPKSEQPVDEQNSLAAAGSGAEVNTGPGIGYMTPNAFRGISRKKRKNH